MRTILKAAAGLLLLPLRAAYALADVYDATLARHKQEKSRTSERRRRKRLGG